MFIQSKSYVLLTIPSFIFHIFIILSKDPLAKSPLEKWIKQETPSKWPFNLEIKNLVKKFNILILKHKCYILFTTSFLSIFQIFIEFEIDEPLATSPLLSTAIAFILQTSHSKLKSKKSTYACFYLLVKKQITIFFLFRRLYSIF